MQLQRLWRWLALALSGLLFTIWGLSIFWEFGWYDPRPGPGIHTLYAVGGCLRCHYSTAASARSPGTGSSPTWFANHRLPNGPTSTRGQYHVDWWFAWGSTHPSGTALYLFVPLWVPFAPMAMMTLWLWSRHRRARRLGQCTCGYPLTGLPVGAACPECGARSYSASGT